MAAGCGKENAMQVSTLRRNVAVAALFAIGTAAAGAATAPATNDDVIAALQVIQRDADAIAAGKYHGKSLQAPAHEIGVKWYQIEPILAKDGTVLVETRMANDAIVAFDKDWKSNGQARKSAKDVSTSVAQLLDAEKQNAQPSPSASQSPGASPSAAPTSSAAPAGSTPPEKPSPSAKTRSH